MNKEEFEKLYKNLSVKDKVKITCNCGKENFILKERAIQNINKHQEYVCRGCSMKNHHKINPFTRETKEKISKSNLGKKYSKETKIKMSLSAKKKWSSEWGKKQKIKLSKQAILQQNNNQLTKSKRKILYKSKKNNNIIICLSSYEFIACDNFLEKDINIKNYQSQVCYKVSDRYRSLDFLIEYFDGTKKIIEIKPQKRLNEKECILQIKDIKNYAKQNNYKFELWTEIELKIFNIKEATKKADQYRKKHYNIDYELHRNNKNCEKVKKYYNKKIKNNKIDIFCNFCNETHNIMLLSYNLNIKKNGRYICLKENGKINGSKPCPNKGNPYSKENKKKCAKCEKILPYENFHKDKSRADGYASRCKQCRIK